jgi:hypothetical protein
MLLSLMQTYIGINSVVTTTDTHIDGRPAMATGSRGGDGHGPMATATRTSGSGVETIPDSQHALEQWNIRAAIHRRLC